MRRIGRFNVVMLPVLVIILFVAFLLVVTAAKPVKADTQKFYPAADTEVDSGSPGSPSHSTDYNMYNGWSPSYGAQRNYLKFDVSVIPSGSTVTSAVLSLLSKYGPSSGAPDYLPTSHYVDAYAVNNDGWVETTLTWDLAQSTYPIVGSALDNEYFQADDYVGQNKRYYWDVTSFVASQIASGDKTISLCLKGQNEDTSNSAGWFYTENGGNPEDRQPYLEVVWGGSPMSITITPENQQGSPGSTLDYTVTVGNNTGAAASFNITVDNTWVTNIPSSVGPIADGGTENVTLTVTCPTTYSVQDTITVTATCQGHPEINANDTCIASTPLLTPSDDTFVNEHSPDYVGGGANSVYVGTQLYQGALEVCRGYWKFDLSGMPSGATIDNAQFKVYTQYGGESGEYPNYVDNTLTVTLKKVDNDSWGEGTTSWSNKPAMGSSFVSVVVPPTHAQRYSWDITSYVASQVASGDRTISLGMISENEGGNALVPWMAKESSYWAGQESYLIVSYTPGQPTRGVDVESISPSSQSGPPGSTLTYTVTVKNTGNMSDTYTLTTADNAGWTRTISPGSLSLAGEASNTATLSVTIPASAAEGASDNITVTATSQADNTVKDNASCIASCQAHGVDVSISPASNSSLPGGVVTFTVTVKNTGIASGTYTLTKIDNASWSPTLSKYSVGPLASGASENVTLSAAVPASAADGVSDSITVTATSQADNTATDSVSCIARCVNPPSIEVSISPSSKSGLSGSTLTYTVTVTNNGLTSDSYTLTKSENATPSWSSLSKTSGGPLASGASENVTLSVTIPAGTAEGASHRITVIATSQTKPTVKDNASCVARAVESIRPRVVVAISPSSKSGAPRDNITFTVTVTNAGNIDDGYNLSATDNLGWGLTLLPSSVTGMAPGEDRTVTLTVEIPDNAADGDSSGITVTATSIENTAVENSATCTARCVTGVTSVTSLTISPSRFALFPGYSGQVQSLTATLRAGNNPLSNKKITWSATAGSVSHSSSTTDALGQVSIYYTAPTVTVETSQVTITASFAGDAQYQASGENSLGIPAIPISVNIPASTGGTVIINVVEINVTVKILVVPANSLSTDTTITVVQAPRESVSNYSMVSRIFNIGPSGTTFTTPSTLTLPYDESELSAGVSEGDLAIYRHTSGGGWERVGGSVNTTANTVSVQIDHLSEYAVMASTVGGSGLPLLTIGVIVAVILIIIVITIFIRRR